MSRDRILSVRLSEDDYKFLMRIAAEHDMNVSDYIRKLLRKVQQDELYVSDAT